MECLWSPNTQQLFLEVLFSPPLDRCVFFFNSICQMFWQKPGSPVFQVNEMGSRSQHVTSASPTKYLLVLENNVKIEFSFLEALGLWDPGVGIFWPSRP